MTQQHQHTTAGPEVMFGPFRFNLGQRTVMRGDEIVRLGSRAREILLALVEREGQVVNKGELFARVWPDTIVEEGALRVHIAALRKALGDRAGGLRYVENVTGQGYRFIAPVVRVDEQRAAPVRHADARDDATDAVEAPSSVESDRSKHIMLELPARLARVFGRHQVIADVSARLLSDRLVTVVGPGGIGKTTVAIAVAHAVAHEFSGEIVFFDLSAIVDAGLVESTLASSLGLAVPTGDPLPSLLAFFRSRRILLVLDNCEHLIEAAAALAGQIARVAPRACVLSTSREALRVGGEQVCALPPLATPSDGIALSAAEALTYPAVQLFVERAASGNRFELTDVNAQLVASVCRRLDGLALALELAARRVTAFGISGTAELLNALQSFPWQAQRTAPSRHQTLEALLDCGYNLLTEPEQSALRRLAIFVGPFTLEAAQAVVSESEKEACAIVSIVATLVDKSLLPVSTHDGCAQYRLLETTRAYALTKLARSGETDAVAERHARYFARLLSQGAPTPFVTIQSLGNVRSALKWSFSSHGNRGLGIELVLAASPVLLRLSLLAECRRWSERAIAALHEDARGTVHELELLEHLAISTMFTRGNDEEVRIAIQRGLEIATTLDNKPREMDLLAGLNIFLTRVGDFNGALQAANSHAALAQWAADPSRAVVSDWMQGVAHHVVGDQALALKHCEAGFRRDTAPVRRHRNVFGYDHRIRALVALARTLWLRGCAQQAMRVAREAIEEAAMLGQPVSICISLIYAASVFLWSGDLVQADCVISQLIQQAHDHSLNPYHAVGRGLLGELMLARGEREPAIDLLKAAVDTLGAGGHLIQVPEFATRLAEALAVQRQYTRALASIEQAIALRARSGASFDMPEILRVKGSILLCSSVADPALAHAHLTRSLGLAQAQSSLAWALRTALTRVQAAPDTPLAHETLAQIYERFTEGFDTPDLQAARRLLHASE